MPPPTTRSGAVYNRLQQERQRAREMLTDEEQELANARINEIEATEGPQAANNWITNALNLWDTMNYEERVIALTGGVTGAIAGGPTGALAGFMAGPAITRRMQTIGDRIAPDRPQIQQPQYTPIEDLQMDEIIASKSFFNLPCTTHVRTTS